MGLDIDLYTPKIDINDNDADDIIIEITGLKSISKFIGLEDTPLYYDNGKFFKVEGNKIVYTDIQWKDISGDISESPEIVAVISDLVNEVASDIIGERINLHNLNEEAHPYIQNIIKQNYDTLDAKIDNTKEELSEALNTEIINRETADNELSENIQQETLARIEADTTLQNNIDTLNQTVINNYTELSEDIVDLTTTVSDNYNTLSGQIDSLSTTVDNNYTSLNNRLTTTEQNILDLTDIVGDNSSDITTIQNTINAYGDIVTYDAANFATKNQGELAETALQPNDNISELTNDVGYITSASLPTVNNATITVQKNGTDVGSFTLNQANNDTINVTVPTQASDIGALPNTTTIEDLTTTTQLAALNSGANTTNIGQITTNKNDIEDINGLIPNQATTSNQLADKSFVNSSIATNTAYFIGTFNSVAELEAYSGTLTNNDYAFVATVDTAGNTLYDRYKWAGTQWLFEYELNNSSFTAEQWGAINSGITSGNVALIETALQPNDNISELTNNVGYITAASLPTVNDATLTIQKNGANIGTFTANSATNSTVNVVVPTDTSDLTNNAGYATETYIDTELLNKQDTLTAGDNIQITNNVISAIDTTYTAGTGIDITNGVISNTQTSAQWGNITGTLSDQTDLQDALDAKQNTLTSENAGTNIEITGDNPTYEDVTVSGTSSVTLENAKANGINYLKLFGSTEQRNLPEGYTQVEYVGGSRNAYADLGTITIEPDDIIYCESILVNNGKLLFGLNNHTRCYVAQSGNGTSNFAGKSYAVPIGTWIVDGTTVNTIKLTSSKFTINGVDFTPTETASSDICSSFGINTVIDGTSGLATSVSYIKKFYIKSGSGNYKVNLIPFRSANNVFGYYDTVSKTLLTNAGTGTFTAGADVVPTPDTPIDIVCNNGVVKLSPNLVDFNEIRINRTTWASADKTKGFEVNADVYNKSVGDQLFTNANCFGVFVPAKINESVSLEFFDYSPAYTRCYYCEVTADGKCNTAPVSFASGDAISQQTFTLTQADSIGFVFEWYISAQQTRNYTKENYMIVRGTTPPTAYMPYGQIYTDGTVETVNVHGKNLFDSTPYKIGYYINASGQEVEATSYQDEYLIRQAIVQPSTTYTISFVGIDANYTQRIHAYDKNGNWISQITTLNPSVGSTTEYTFTTPVNCKYVRQGGRSQSNYQLELGSTATEYEEYFDGGTATAEMLLKVGNYQDVQSVLDGSVIHRCGIKVLDGTENWTTMGGTKTWGHCYVLGTPIPNAMSGININCYSTHFKAVSRCWDTATGPCFSFHQSAISTWTGKLFFVVEQDTVQKFNQYLADQYNAGNPVVVVYPLAEPTTESVTGQALTIQEGTNVVSATGSVDSLPLEVEYVKQTIGGLKINFVNDSGFATTTELNTGLAGKQETLVSGTNIKTINGNSILGSGNLVIEGGGGSATWGSIGGTLSAQTDLQNALDAKQDTISDLSTIRSGASLGATALQPNDNITELVNNAGYITGITSSDVTTALGYTPYNATNPNGYTSNVGTVTSVNNVQPVNGNVTLSIPSAVTESTVSGWGFTKNTGTVTSVNNVQPVNGNVTLTIPDTSNLANKDLSNLSSTGNAKFQAPLVSGTNIKTINNNSLLGSGNLTLDGLPSQTGQSGKFLTTDGTDASWATVTIPTPTYDSTNERITW